MEMAGVEAEEFLVRNSVGEVDPVRADHVIPSRSQKLRLNRVEIEGRIDLGVKTSSSDF